MRLNSPRLSSEKQNNHSKNMLSSILKSRILVAPICQSKDLKKGFEIINFVLQISYITIPEVEILSFSFQNSQKLYN